MPCLWYFMTPSPQHRACPTLWWQLPGLERQIFSKAEAWFDRETDAVPPEIVAFMRARQAIYPIATFCRVLKVAI